ncbi:MAG: hypothetical protein FK731_04745, partial [Asgard group archaeon]|nr:hypothetical protein [Asgard group archaeon]
MSKNNIKKKTDDKNKKSTKEEIQNPKANKKIKSKKFWIWTKYFVMKWRFRLDQSRAIFGLITFAILLADSYAPKIPWFMDQGFWRGEFILALLIFIIFALGGYLYDRSFKLWSETTTVSIERNPYTYVPNPKEQWQSRAIWTFVFTILSQMAEKLDLEIENEDFMRLFIQHYYSLTPGDEDIVQESAKLSKIADIFEKAFLNRGKISSFDEIIKENLKEE